MELPIQKKLGIAFWVLALVDIAGISLDLPVLHYTAKPLLMPALLLLMHYSPTAPGKGLLMTGLVFAWLGDVLLMFESRHALFFIFGLVSFLTTHVFYILYFLLIRSAAPSLLRRQPVWIALVTGYGLTLVWQLFPKLGEMTLPVIVYAIVICSMLLGSLHVFLKINRKAALLFTAGAVCFVLSDSLLAVNKFYQPFAYAGLLIMLTYCAAQYFIVSGYINRKS